MWHRGSSGLAWAGDKSAAFRDDNNCQNHRYFTKYADARKQLQRNLENQALNLVPRRAHCVMVSHFARKCLAWGVLGVVKALNSLPDPTFCLYLRLFTYLEKFSQRAQGVFLAFFFNMFFFGKGGRGRCKLTEIFTKTCTGVDFGALGGRSSSLACVGWWLRDHEMYSGSPRKWGVSRGAAWFQEIRGKHRDGIRCWSTKVGKHRVKRWTNFLSCVLDEVFWWPTSEEEKIYYGLCKKHVLNEQILFNEKLFWVW